MYPAFKNRHFLKLLDYTPAEIAALLDLAAELKEKKKALKRPEITDVQISE